MTRATRARPRSGFTLVEVLVALAVLSLLVTTAYGGMRIAGRSVAAGEERARSAADFRVVQDFLRRNLSRAFPMAVQQENRWQLWFEGEPERVRLLVDLPGYVGEGGLHELDLAVETEDGASRLVLSQRIAGAAPDEESDAEPLRRVLADGMDSIVFDYFGSLTPRDPPEWREEWRDAQRMPRLVRMRAVSAADGPWPVLVVALRVDSVRFQRDVASPAATPGSRQGASPSDPTRETQ